MASDTERTLLAFVRGEASWDALARLGLVRSTHENRITVGIPAAFPVVRPTLADVASGLISQPSEQRQEWAAVLLALDNVDLVHLEHDKRGTSLLDAIWDAAAGHVSDTSLSAARAILTGANLEN